MHNNIRRTVGTWESQQISLSHTYIPQLTIHLRSAFSPFSDFIDLQNESLVCTVPKNKWKFYLLEFLPPNTYTWSSLIWTANAS